MSCDEMRAVTPELALGILTGKERGAALSHLAECPDCRRHVDELVATSDELLLAAPSVEPPAGFEEGALERMQRPSRIRHMWLAAAAAVLLLVGMAGGVILAGRDDTRSVRLRAGDGRTVGTVFLHAGSSPWVFVNVDRGRGTFECTVELVTDDGVRRLTGLRMRDGIGSWGTTTSTSGVDEVRVTWPGANAPYIART